MKYLINKLYVNNHVKKIMGDGKDYKLGENIFLFPNKRSLITLSTAEYMVVSSDGQSQLLKQDGEHYCYYYKWLYEKTK